MRGLSCILPSDIGCLCDNIVRFKFMYQCVVIKSLMLCCLLTLRGLICILLPDIVCVVVNSGRGIYRSSVLLGALWGSARGSVPV